MFIHLGVSLGSVLLFLLQHVPLGKAGVNTTLKITQTTVLLQTSERSNLIMNSNSLWKTSSLCLRS